MLVVVAAAPLAAMAQRVESSAFAVAADVVFSRFGERASDGAATLTVVCGVSDSCNVVVGPSDFYLVITVEAGARTLFSGAPLAGAGGAVEAVLDATEEPEEVDDGDWPGGSDR